MWTNGVLIMLRHDKFPLLSTLKKYLENVFIVIMLLH